MKKRCIALLLGCLLTLALAACAQKTPAPATEPAPQNTQTAQTPEPQPQPAEPEPAAEPERPVVEGNGGYFVRVDDKVWFRRYDDGVVDESQLWGDFLEVWPSHPVSSKLCCYDEKTGAVTEAMGDDGFGKLWFGVDGFYLTHRSSNGEHSGAAAYYKTLDGTVTELCDGETVGASDNGRFAAVSTINFSIAVYEGAKELFEAKPQEGEHYLEYAGLTDDGVLICVSHARNEEKMTLRAVDAKGNATDLGEIPALPEESTAWGWEFEQCLIDGNDVWCAFGAYEGTGHFLSETLCVRAKLGAENSLETVEDQPNTEYPYVPKLWRKDGKVMRTEHIPGELSYVYDTGDLSVYGDDGAESVVVGGFLATGGYEDESRIAQTMENLNGAAYLIVAQAFRDPDNDIGWRMAYTPGTLYYVRVPLTGEAKAETLTGEQYVVYPTVSEVNKRFIGKWQLFATEVEGDRNDTLSEGTWETIEFFADGSALITGSDYQNRFLHAEVLATNGVSGDASDYGLLITDGTNDDMVWAYFEGDTLVATVMVHFLVDGATDSYSRSGFYQRSAG